MLIHLPAYYHHLSSSPLTHPLGGRLNAFGMVFTNSPDPNPPVFIDPDTSRAVRVFGGR